MENVLEVQFSHIKSAVNFVKIDGAIPGNGYGMWKYLFGGTGEVRK